MKRSLILSSLLMLVATGCEPDVDSTSFPGLGENSDNLAEARKGFTTKLRTRGKAPQPFDNEQPPAGVTQVEYTSDSLQLKGWLSNDAKDGKKRPAVVFLHGGWAFGGEDWQGAQPFVNAGFVLFMPMLRGENGNPGNYEAFFGEVDDAVAAGKYVASLPNVDSKNVFVTGHSVGGILTALVSMMPSPYKAAAALDGHVDMASFTTGLPSECTPYNRRDDEELRLRNPLEFAASIRCPLRLYTSREAYPDGVHLRDLADVEGTECEVVPVRGDHQTMVPRAVEKTIAWFQELMANDVSAK